MGSRRMESDAKPADAALDADIDGCIEPPLLQALSALDGRAPLLAGMVRYHLGYADRELSPVDPGSIDRGKRIRPAVAILAAGAAGGDARAAAPVAAAIELLHNFTLIHDDVQDESPMRRHRPTVWSIWGIGQAINAGDALFAAAHLPLYRLPHGGASAPLALQLLESFDRMTIDIVEGQILDLGFEGRRDVEPDAYLDMIAGKTAAIVRYAAWAGSLLGGADHDAAARWSDFGLALGLGFQLRDDLLGIWGESRETGKAAADDIRRRKQSLPMLLLRQRLNRADRDELDALLAQPEVSGEGVALVLDMMERQHIRADIEAEITRHHDQASAALIAAAPARNPSRDRLASLVERLATRAG